MEVRVFTLASFGFKLAKGQEGAAWKFYRSQMCGQNAEEFKVIPVTGADAGVTQFRITPAF